MTAEDQFPTKKRRSGLVLSGEQGQALLLTLVAFVFVFFLWQTTAGTWMLYPFRLLATFVHEIGHGLTAALTGGNFYSFQVFGDGSGVAYTSGGSRFLIVQMGYLGATLFGAALFYLTNRACNVKWVATGTGVFFIGCSLLFATRSAGGLTGAIGSLFALIIGAASGIGLIALGSQGSRPLTLFILNALSFIIGFNAINDISSLMRARDAHIGNIPNDAMVMATMTHIPTEVWIVLWLGLSIAVMSNAILFALILPMRDNAAR